MNIHAIRLAPLFAFCLSALASVMAWGDVPSNLTDATVTFHVQVVSSPCHFQDNTEIIVEMGETSTRTLQTQQYGDWHTFTLGFTECNTDTFQNVAIQFLGTEDTHLPGRLALDSSSGAKAWRLGFITAIASLQSTTTQRGSPCRLAIIFCRFQHGLRKQQKIHCDPATTRQRHTSNSAISEQCALAHLNGAMTAKRLISD